MATRGVVPVRAGCGGAEIVVYELARSMAELGHRVTLVGEVDESDFELPAGLDVVQVRNAAQRATRWLPDGLAKWMVQHLFGNIAVARTTRRLLRERPGSFDIVHAHGALSAALISIGHPSHLVYTEHDATPWSCRYRRWYERMLRKAIYRSLNVVAFKRADRVITVFPSLAEEIITYWNVPREHVTVVSNGADPTFLDWDPEPAGAAESEVSFSNYALFVGSLVPRKCPDLLLDALAETPDLPCVFVGDGPMRPTLERRAQELGIAERVTMLGTVSRQRLANVYRDADMLVLPTVSDAFPLVALEAMACGTPVLATRVSGLPEMIEDWQTGFLVKPGDVGQLAMGLRFLAGDPDLRRHMGRNARTRVLEGFQWSAVAERYLDVFRTAAGEGRVAGETNHPETIVGPLVTADAPTEDLRVHA